MAKSDQPLPTDPASVYEVVGKLVSTIAPLAFNCRIVYEVPGGMEGVIPIAAPRDDKTEDLKEEIAEVCNRLKQGDRLRGKAVAAELKHPYDSYFRGILAELGRKGDVCKDIRGYGPKNDAVSGADLTSKPK